MHFQWGGNLSLVTLTFDHDIQTHLSDVFGHVFHVNLPQICSSVPVIFRTQTDKKVTDSTKNRTLCSSLHLVRLRLNRPCAAAMRSYVKLL